MVRSGGQDQTNAWFQGEQHGMVANRAPQPEGHVECGARWRSGKGIAKNIGVRCDSAPLISTRGTWCSGH